MAIIRITTPSIADDAIDNTKLDLADDYTFTGTVEGAGGGIFESQLLHVRDEKAQGTDGGSTVVGINTQNINTVMTNEITGASLSSNQVTLPSGTYYIDAELSCLGNNADIQAYLYNVTDSSNEVIGNSTNTTYGEPHLQLKSRFTISAQKVFEFRFYTSSAFASVGLGKPVNQTTEVYSDVRIWKVA